MSTPLWMKALERRKKIGKDDLAEIGGKGTSSAVTKVTPAPTPRSPEGSMLGGDAKNIKIRKKVEDDPEYGFDRGLAKSKKKRAASSY